jgi:hypothetical protein
MSAQIPLSMTQQGMSYAQSVSIVTSAVRLLLCELEWTSVASRAVFLDDPLECWRVVDISRE